MGFPWPTGLSSEKALKRVIALLDLLKALSGSLTVMREGSYDFRLGIPSPIHSNFTKRQALHALRIK